MVNIEQFRLGLIDQLNQRLHNTLSDDNVKMGTANKLRTYREHTPNYTTMLNYLQVVSNFKHRKALSKLRVSDHKPNIEVGRHTELYLSDRICTSCNVDIEDEKHFLLKCTVYVYANLRKTLFDDIVTDLPYFQEATTMTQFKILSNPRERVAVHVARFVYIAFKLRKSQC